MFLGLGANYDWVNINQKSWGKGIAGIQTSTGISSNGNAQGTGAPFNKTNTTVMPSLQAGYLKHYSGTDYLYGLKFSYQYLGTTATNPNLYIPQVGLMTSNTGVTSPLFGWVNADSVQVNTNHEFTLLGFIGQSFGNKYVYLGAGPALFNLQSSNYYSIGYAQFNGVTVNVTGLISYSSPPIWAWGGAAQLGMAYFISPTWFIDASYTYATSGSNTVDHQQAFLNTSSILGVQYTASGTIYTTDTLRVNTQALSLSINKIFDL